MEDLLCYGVFIYNEIQADILIKNIGPLFCP